MAMQEGSQQIYKRVVLAYQQQPAEAWDGRLGR